MSSSERSFSLPSFRRLYKEMGQLDALVEVTELAARHFAAAAKAHPSIEAFIEHESKVHGIRVQIGEWDAWQQHLNGTYIVIVYQSAEKFLRAFRLEHEYLHGQPWKVVRKKKGKVENKKKKKKTKALDPLTAALRNIDGAEKHLGRDIISRFQYYRLIRNSMAHRGDKAVRKLKKNFSKIRPYSQSNKDLYGRLSAPNTHEQLTFDDFVLFSRLVKQIGEVLCSLSLPPKERWQSIIPFGKFQRAAKAGRAENAIRGWLRTEFGLDEATALDIPFKLESPLA